MKKSQKEISKSILTETDLKQIKLVSNDGKDTPTYLVFTNDLKENPKKGIFISKIINSHGRKQGLEIYQTTTGCEDVMVIIKPIKDTNNENGNLEITFSGIFGDFIQTNLFFPEVDLHNIDKHTKSILIDLIKSNLQYMTQYSGNPIYIK